MIKGPPNKHNPHPTWHPDKPIVPFHPITPDNPTPTPTPDNPTPTTPSSGPASLPNDYSGGYYNPDLSSLLSPGADSDGNDTALEISGTAAALALIGGGTALVLFIFRKRVAALIHKLKIR